MGAEAEFWKAVKTGDRHAVESLRAADPRLATAPLVPLHSAAAARSVPIARLMLERGAPVNARLAGRLGSAPWS